MADTDDIEKKEDQEAEKNEKQASGGGILQWIIMAAAVAVFAGAGFGLGRLFGGSGADAKNAETSQKQESIGAKYLKADDSAADQKTWYYHLEPVVANLDVPGVTRYVRATLILEISSELDQAKGNTLLEKKKPVLTNWLTIYLASLSLEDARGGRNLKHIQSQILDAFNEELFPDARPQIRKILLKEFAIQ